jgi:hypothetical protein
MANCIKCGTPLPADSHKSRRFCGECQFKKQRQNQIDWRNSHPDEFRAKSLQYSRKNRGVTLDELIEKARISVLRADAAYTRAGIRLASLIAEQAKGQADG